MFKFLLSARNKVQITSNTEGVSIGYRKSWKDSWSVYEKPFDWQKGDSLYVAAHRIGYDKAIVSIIKN